MLVSEESTLQVSIWASNSRKFCCSSILRSDLMFFIFLTHSLVSHPIFCLSWVTSVTRSVVFELLSFSLAWKLCCRSTPAPVYTKQFRLQREWSPFSHSSAMKLSTFVKQCKPPFRGSLQWFVSNTTAGYVTDAIIQRPAFFVNNIFVEFAKFFSLENIRLYCMSR